MAEARPPYLANLDMLPPEGRGRIRRYIEEGYGLSMSTFYKSIIAGDLEAARAGADAENQAAIPAYIEYLETCAPADCHGSYEALSTWRGLGAAAGL